MVFTSLTSAISAGFTERQLLFYSGVYRDEPPPPIDFQKAAYIVHEGIGDGVADESDLIQSAIDCCFSMGGGVVIFRTPKVFYSIKKSLRLPSNVSLVGGVQKPLIKYTGTGTSKETGSVIINSDAYLSGNENIHIRSLRLESTYADNIIPSDGSRNIGALYGIFFAGVRNFSVVDCEIANTVAESIYIGGVSGVRDLCSYGLISANTIENSYASGIAITCGSSLRIVNNHVKNTGIFGIDVEPNTGCDGRDISITGNVIDDVKACYYKNTISQGLSNAQGINISTGSLPGQVSGITISSNVVKNINVNSFSGFNDFGCIALVGVKNVSVSSNSLSASKSSGIVVRSGSSVVSVSGNNIDATEANGVIVSASSDVSISGNAIDRTLGRGIAVNNAASFVTVSANTIRDAVGSGVYLQNCTKTAVSSNAIRDTKSGAARTMQSGVHVASLCSDVSVSGNVIGNVTSDSVRNVDSSLSVSISGNL